MPSLKTKLLICTNSKSQLCRSWEKINVVVSASIENRKYHNYTVNREFCRVNFKVAGIWK